VEARDRGLQKRHRGYSGRDLLDFPLLHRTSANRWWTVGSKTASFGMENDKL
jgi:hypothetical protein